LIEFPLLLVVGAFVGYALDERFAETIGRCNRIGLVGFSFAATTLAYWMIPAALDAAVLNRAVAAGKYATLVLSGSLLWSSFRAAPLAVQAFFVGTFVWMTATFGLVYQSEPQQLCLSYLPDAQWLAGRGLVVTALVAGSWWCISVAPRLLMPDAKRQFRNSIFVRR
jgi:hypothetical protein